MGLIQVFYSANLKEIKKLSKITNVRSKYEILKTIDSSIGIGKSWEVIPFIITGKKGPNDHLISKLFYPDNYTIELSDQEEKIADRDDFYTNDEYIEIANKLELGIAFSSPNEVKEIFNFLVKLNFEEVLKNFDYSKFKGKKIYPINWSGSKSDQEYILDHYRNLLSLLKVATSRNDYILSECS